VDKQVQGHVPPFSQRVGHSHVLKPQPPVADIDEPAKMAEIRSDGDEGKVLRGKPEMPSLVFLGHGASQKKGLSDPSQKTMPR
jgi:hypothetical protein